MAGIEAKKMEKDENRGTKPVVVGWITETAQIVPRKLQELKTFFSEVKAELKKVSWPSRQEVQTTTVVVIATSIFFGFYLFSADMIFSRVMKLILR